MRTLTVVFIAALLAGLAARAEAQNGYYYYGPGGNAGHYWNGLPASKGDAYPWEHSQSWNDRHWNERRHWRHDHDDGQTTCTQSSGVTICGGSPAAGAR